MVTTYYYNRHFSHCVCHLRWILSQIVLWCILAFFCSAKDARCWTSSENCCEWAHYHRQIFLKHHSVTKTLCAKPHCEFRQNNLSEGKNSKILNSMMPKNRRSLVKEIHFGMLLITADYMEKYIFKIIYLKGRLNAV